MNLDSFMHNLKVAPSSSALGVKLERVVNPAICLEQGVHGPHN